MELSKTYTAADKEGGTVVPDEALMAWVKTGDEHALAELIRRYEGPLFNYARKMLGNAADAEEIFQETFLRVYQHRNRFWAGSPFRPWLYRIATNLCKDKLRYRKRHPEVNASALAGGDDRDGYDPIAQQAAGGVRPDEAAIAREMALRMEEALAALSVKHRAVFLMAHQEGMPYGEIAKALRIPTGTVKSRMNTAVKQLMAAMEASE